MYGEAEPEVPVLLPVECEVKAAAFLVQAPLEEHTAYGHEVAHREFDEGERPIECNLARPLANDLMPLVPFRRHLERGGIGGLGPRACKGGDELLDMVGE